MSMIAGRMLPTEKHLEISLTHIFGIGRSRAKKICEATGIPVNTKFRDVTEAQKEMIRSYISEHFTVEGDLRREVMASIKELMDCGCYRGRRHRAGLPMRSRTKTNAKTAKKRGKKKK